MQRTRVRDLTLSFLPDGGFLVRAPARGVAARVPVHAVELLSFCSVERTRQEVEARYGPMGIRLYEGLTELGFLVDPRKAAETPVMFENFASLDVHRRMLGDRARMDAYARAIAAVVKPGMAVMDAGTGSGILAGLAARAGARVVYAVDNSDMIDVATEVFRASGFGDRVRAIRADIAEVKLPEPVDVIVSETFGALALAEGGLDDVRAAAANNLARGGVVVPRGLSLWLAPVGDGVVLEEAMAPFAAYGGVELGVLRGSALHRGMTVTLAPGQLLDPGGAFATLPFPGEPRAVGRVHLPGVRGRVVGFAGWFSLDMADGIVLGTGPADAPTHWRQQFLPVDPFDVAGDLELAVEMGRALADRRGAEVRVEWAHAGGEGAGFYRVR